jgi:hypothetical protein
MSGIPPTALGFLYADPDAPGWTFKALIRFGERDSDPSRRAAPSSVQEAAQLQRALQPEFRRSFLYRVADFENDRSTVPIPPCRGCHASAFRMRKSRLVRLAERAVAQRRTRIYVSGEDLRTSSAKPARRVQDRSAISNRKG